MRITTEKRYIIKCFLIFYLCLQSFSLVFGQGNSVEAVESVFQMELEQLMNMKIVSASKKSESTFDAPFSSSVITKEEIKKAGCTSIMEAFRLMPALIVREQTNGNFDIHIRGLDNVPPYSVMINAINTTTLVMIDNRPVYNYLQGGTFWESLPIDINDVQRIEVVRGPSSSMYGPNAVSGVIQIITRKPEKAGLYTVANAQGGLRSYIGNTSVGYKFNSKVNIGVSGNFQLRKREEAIYYLVKDNTYNTLADFDVNNLKERYPHPDRSMNKKALNLFANYAPTERRTLNFSAGLQDSEVQNVFGENLITPISTNTSKTRYADFKFSINDLSGQISYLGGTQNPTLGFTGSKYDLNTIEGYIEYSLKLGPLTVKPGYNFRKAIYNDSKYWDGSVNEGIISGENQITTNAVSVRSDVKLLNEKLRFFSGVRLDRFNYPEKIYFSYQFAPTFTINSNNLIRLVASKANRAPLVYDTYLDFNQWSQLDIPFPPYKLPFLVHVLGSNSLKLVTSHMYEVGYRSRIAKNLQLDIDIFNTQTTNYTDLIIGATDITKFPIKAEVKVINIPLKVNQLGGTLALNVVLNKIHVKPFVTVQKTILKKSSPYTNTADAFPTSVNPNPETYNYLAVKDSKHLGTPTLYGGAYVNYQVTNKINLNFNPYFYSAQTFFHRENVNYGTNDERGVGKIDPKLILNARVSYKPTDSLDVFVSGKNILGDTSREFYRSDQIGPSALAGINFEF